MATMQQDGLTTEQWLAVIVLLSLGALVAIHLGFRGVEFGGVSIKAT